MTPDTADALAILVYRAEAGDAKARAELEAGLPDLIPWSELEELARQAREAWAAAPCGTNVGPAARLRALDRVTAQLARPGAGPLERLLASQAALAAARLADLRRLNDQGTSGAIPAVARDLARRVRGAKREAATADRVLRAFRERLPVEH